MLRHLLFGLCILFLLNSSGFVTPASSLLGTDINQRADVNNRAAVNHPNYATAADANLSGANDYTVSVSIQHPVKQNKQQMYNITHWRQMHKAQSTTQIDVPLFGLNSHLATRYPDPSSMHVPAEQIAALGVSWVREDFHWHRVEPQPNVWDWTFTDAAMREILSRNIQVLGVLGPSVGWATPFPGDAPNDASFYAPDPTHYIEYVQAVVNRYKHYIHHWEIWNEPDNTNFWKPQPDPQAYAELLIQAYAAIKAIDPQAQVLIGGFSPFDTTFVQSVAEAGAWASFDILAIHPYIDPYSPENGNISNIINIMRSLHNRFGAKPVWVTELGWPSGASDRDPIGVIDEQIQASYLTRALLLFAHAGIERTFWYTLKDDPGNPYGLFRFGTGRADFSQPKPTFNAFRALNKELAGATFTEKRDLFAQSVLIDFEQDLRWKRIHQPNGNVQSNTLHIHNGQRSLQFNYNFNTNGNDYLVMEHHTPIPINGRPFGLGVWIYGDNSSNQLKMWLRDAEGEILQYSMGVVGPTGWNFVSTPIGDIVEPGNRITNKGNGRLDFPAQLVAFVIDDVNDRVTGKGAIYIDDLTVINGIEAYNLRLKRNQESLDILWSTIPIRIGLDTKETQGLAIEDNETEKQINVDDGHFILDLTDTPLYVRHRR